MTIISYKLINLCLTLITLTKKKWLFCKKDEKQEPFIKTNCKKQSFTINTHNFSIEIHSISINIIGKKKRRLKLTSHEDKIDLKLTMINYEN